MNEKNFSLVSVLVTPGTYGRGMPQYKRRIGTNWVSWFDSDPDMKTPGSANTGNSGELFNSRLIWQFSDKLAPS